MDDNKHYWDRGAKIYDRIMKKDTKAYSQMYSYMRKRLNPNTSVLELATGTGLIALNIAKYVKNIEATDFSEEMIKIAKKKSNCSNINFSVQDACNLTYADKSFDVIIISNALHIMPNPQKALSEIKRVLTDDGILIAPNFTHKRMTLFQKAFEKIATFTGFKTFSEWTSQEYVMFLENNGFDVTYLNVLKASFPLTYVESKKMTVN